MSDKVVAGADFNVTKENPNETWLVVGRISNLGLEILDVKKTGSHVLGKDLAAHKTLSALGIECPFSLPAAFLDFLAVKKTRKEYQSWQEVVEELVFIPADEFTALAKEFGKEGKRITDGVAGTSALSPLKRSNPPMHQLTFHGMRVLASLDPSRYFVLPFQDAIPFGCALLEVNTRDTLKHFGINDSAYKPKDKLSPDQAEAGREKIISNLTKLKERKALTYRDYPSLIIQKQFTHNFLHSDSALSALIACYTTALFAAAPSHFDDPFEADALEVLLEGWTYRAKQLT
ncbi:MAG: hypothetical protein JST01_16260 [Cyanobacteria bacterium SZAS TMP-1]|nr:hypothetical protein [Cyanobacteria bacterium SZAS TMP-1]